MALLGLPRQLVTLIKINHTAGLRLRSGREFTGGGLESPCAQDGESERRPGRLAGLST